MIGLLEKAFGAKDYSKLIPVQQIDSLGRHITVWKLPEDAKQKPLFEGKDAGADAPVGKRGYVDHVDKETQRLMIDPLVKRVQEVNPELAGRMNYKYSNYRYDRDTKELDIQHDYDMAWYMRKMRADPANREAYQKEYEQKTDKTVRQINNRKASMSKVKKGQQVTYYGRPATVQDFSRRGYPVIQTERGTTTAFWEEIS